MKVTGECKELEAERRGSSTPFRSGNAPVDTTGLLVAGGTGDSLDWDCAGSLEDGGMDTKAKSLRHLPSDLLTSMP